MNNSDVRKIVVSRGSLAESESLRIFNTYFFNWAEYNSYIYKKFDILFDKKILDIGSSYGHNLIHFSKDSVGIEVRHDLVQFSRGLGLNVVEGNIEDSLPISEKFDLVWCTDFLVHLVSPYKFLYDCRKLLNTGGKIVIQIPLMSILNNHKSSCHFYAFNKKSLIYLLEMAGYKIIKTSGCVRKIPNFLNYLLEPVLQIIGGNIWILAEKRECDFNFEKSFLPAWFTR